jgi:hypothetical protein
MSSIHFSRILSLLSLVFVISSQLISLPVRAASSLIIDRNNNDGGQTTFTDPISCTNPITGTFSSTEKVDYLDINLSDVDNIATFGSSASIPNNQDPSFKVVKNSNGSYNYTYNLNAASRSGVIKTSRNKIELTIRQINQGVSTTLAKTTYIDSIDFNDCLPDNFVIVKGDNPGTTSSKSFPAGTYLLTVSGTYGFGGGSIADAAFSLRPKGFQKIGDINYTEDTWEAGKDLQPGFKNMLELKVNNKIVAWGNSQGPVNTYRPDHIYQVEINKTDNGPFNFSIDDVFHGDNSGSLKVKIDQVITLKPA